MRTAPALLLIALALVATSACTEDASVPISDQAPASWRDAPESTDPNEYAHFLKGGDGSLSGQAFLMTRGGEPRRCSGREVYLDPATSFSRGWWSTYKDEGKDPEDEDFLSARRTATCDADGRFRFSGLAPGNYFLLASVIWETPGARGLPVQGGMLGKEIEIGREGEVEVILADKDFLTGGEVLAQALADSITRP